MGVQRIDLGVLRSGQVIVVVALDGLVQERKAEEEYKQNDGKNVFTRQIPV
jgi:hypothetical protein